MKPGSARLLADHRPEQIAIRRAGQADPILVQHASPGTRPFIHPILAPDGEGTLTENAPAHHPWQHGLYVGLNDVNGIGFWSEGLTGSREDGSFHPHPLAAPQVEGQRCRWSVTTDWRHPDGRTMLRETQAWSLHDLGDRYDLDLDWSLHADLDLTFGAYAYGGLFVRMPFSAANRERSTVVNSNGQQTPAGTEAQRARWVAIALPIPDRRTNDPIAGLAMMDHPSNVGHPVPWRVDGQLGISPSRCIAGAWTLRQGTTWSARHRVFIHTGATDLANIESSWSRFIS